MTTTTIALLAGLLILAAATFGYSTGRAAALAAAPGYWGGPKRVTRDLLITDFNRVYSDWHAALKTRDPNASEYEAEFACLITIARAAGYTPHLTADGNAWTLHPIIRDDKETDQ